MRQYEGITFTGPLTMIEKITYKAAKKKINRSWLTCYYVKLGMDNSSDRDILEAAEKDPRAYSRVMSRDP